MSRDPISPERNTEIQQKAGNDARNGEYKPPSGDMLVDAVFAIPDLLSGSKSTQQIASEEKPIYDAVWNQTKKP